MWIHFERLEHVGGHGSKHYVISGERANTEGNAVSIYMGAIGDHEWLPWQMLLHPPCPDCGAGERDEDWETFLGGKEDYETEAVATWPTAAGGSFRRCARCGSVLVYVIRKSGAAE